MIKTKIWRVVACKMMACEQIHFIRSGRKYTHYFLSKRNTLYCYMTIDNKWFNYIPFPHYPLLSPTIPSDHLTVTWLKEQVR